MTSAPQRPPVGRYGPEPTQGAHPWHRLALAALVLAVVAVATWVGIGVLRDPVQWRDVGYHVDDATSIQITFDVTKDVAASATCRVQALSTSYAQVGVHDAVVGPGATRTQRVTVQVATSERAVTGTVVRCTLDE